MITLIFSSHNGSRTLPTMLKALCNIKIQADKWNIIAIDNGSTDDTYKLLKSYSSRLPINVLQHLERGKNKALNHGLNYIKGELVIFTDDDVIPHNDWLFQLEKIASSQPSYNIFGGAILPSWPSPPPNWVLEHTPIGITYALTSPDLQEKEIDPGLIWGPNMMVRSHVFKNGNRFNENVGPSSGSYIMGSETEFNLRMAKQGHRCYFAPAAKVSHIIRPEQMERNWVLRRAYRFGKNMYVQNNSDDIKTYPTIYGVPRWMLKKMAQKFLEGQIKGSLFNTTKSFEAMWDVWHIAGYISQALLAEKK